MPADPTDLPPRFRIKFCVADSGCWEWMAAKSSSGYGRFLYRGSMRAAHRYSYEAIVGPIPEGLQLDHLCRNRGCVNPAHLEAVTPRENTLRSTLPEVTARRHAAQTHCRNGHEYTEENTYTYVSASGASWRVCRQCSRARTQRRYAQEGVRRAA